MEAHTAAQQHIADHFDVVAGEYDYWKEKNWLYYETLRSIARAHVPQEGRLLDVGCGTGAMVRAVAPMHALGIDIAPEMVEIAKRLDSEHPEYRYEVADITNFRLSEQFDTLLFFDVIEHTVDMPAALRCMRDLMAPRGVLVLSMANPLWEPILMLGEKLGMKMPEGPHYRMSAGELLTKAADAGLKLQAREWHLLFPKYIPLFSAFCNTILARVPLIQHLCVIEVFVFEKA